MNKIKMDTWNSKRTDKEIIYTEDDVPVRTVYVSKLPQNVS